MKIKTPFAALLALAFCLACGLARAQVDLAVVEDQGVAMTRGEVEELVKGWSPNMREAAANNEQDMRELLNKLLSTKKIEYAARNLDPQEHPELYWKSIVVLRDRLKKLMIDYHVASLEIPDMNELAREMYSTDPEKYGRIPQQRISSHILIGCEDKKCAREDKRALADEVYAKLQAGQKFEDLASEYSDDTASKQKGGRFDRWIKAGERGIDEDYVKALYAIEEVGTYSPVTISQFGYHIIRLDEIEESYTRPFEDVEQAMIADMVNEYKRQSLSAYLSGFWFTDDVYIDNTVMKEILAPYRTARP